MHRLALSLLVLAGCSTDEMVDFVYDAEQAYFESVLEPADTYNISGPYRVEAYVVAPRGARRLTLRISDDAVRGLYADLAMRLDDGDEVQGRWLAELPGRPAGSAYFYYLVLTDELEQTVLHPKNAPRALLSFKILSEPE